MAGISYRQDLANDFILRGEQRRLQLEREPTNVKDPNAIRVVAVWEEEGKTRQARIGYVPAETAKVIAARYADAPLAAVWLLTRWCPRTARAYQ